MITDKFKTVTISSKEELNKFLNDYKSISCEMCFGNLFSWGGTERTEYYIDSIDNLEEVLYIRSVLCGKPKYYFPVSKNPQNSKLKSKSIENLINFDKNIKFINLVKEQAEFLTQYFNFEITERRDRSEYIYEAEKLRTFYGKKLHGKKNHLNKFYSLYNDRYTFEKINKNNLCECLELSWKWRNININGHGSDADSMLEEFYIVRNFVDYYDKLDLLGGCIKIDGKIKAFTIGEPAFKGSDCIIIHVEKAEYDEIDGIYPAICSMFLNAYPEFDFVNREDDLGDDGLRQSKLSYRPLYLIDRFETV